jgi:hypothetical protein
VDFYPKEVNMAPQVIILQTAGLGCEIVQRELHKAHCEEGTDYVLTRDESVLKAAILHGQRQLFLSSLYIYPDMDGGERLAREVKTANPECFFFLLSVDNPSNMEYIDAVISKRKNFLWVVPKVVNAFNQGATLKDLLVILDENKFANV